MYGINKDFEARVYLVVLHKTAKQGRTAVLATNNGLNLLVAIYLLSYLILQLFHKLLEMIFKAF